MLKKYRTAIFLVLAFCVLIVIGTYGDTVRYSWRTGVQITPATLPPSTNEPISIIVNSLDDVPYNTPDQCPEKCTLREAANRAIQHPLQPLLITFDSELKGEIQLQSRIQINGNITVQGHKGQDITISGGSDDLNRINKPLFEIETPWRWNVMLTLRYVQLRSASSWGREGGAIYVAPRTTLSLDYVTIQNSLGHTIGGGAIYNDEGTLFIDHSYFIGNVAQLSPSYEPNPQIATAHFGGAIYNKGGAITITNSTFMANSAVGYGGAIYNKGGNLSIDDTRFTNNHALTHRRDRLPHSPDVKLLFGNGGAIYNDDGNVHINRAYFERNSAQTDGSAIYNASGKVIIYNSTFVENVAYQSGAVYNSRGSVEISNGTFIENAAGGFASGGALFSSDGIITIRNTILRGMLRNDGSTNIVTRSTCAGNILAVGPNIQFPGTDCGAAIRTIDPRLGNSTYMRQFGEYYSINPDSPAIDAGDSNACKPDLMGTMDQIRNPRIMNGGHADQCDIGAVEYDINTPPTATAIPIATPS